MGRTGQLQEAQGSTVSGNALGLLHEFWIGRACSQRIPRGSSPVVSSQKILPSQSAEPVTITLYRDGERLHREVKDLDLGDIILDYLCPKCVKGPHGGTRRLETQQHGEKAMGVEGRMWSDVAKAKQRQQPPEAGETRITERNVWGRGQSFVYQSSGCFPKALPLKIKNSGG